MQCLSTSASQCSTSQRPSTMPSSSRPPSEGLHEDFLHVLAVHYLDPGDGANDIRGLGGHPTSGHVAGRSEDNHHANWDGGAMKIMAVY